MTEDISTTDEKKLQDFFDDSTQENLEDLEDWMLAGLVMWQEVTDDQKDWIIDKLPSEPEKMFIKHSGNYRISESSITFKEIREPYIESAVMSSGCRGKHPWPNRLMKKGDLRLSIKVPNPKDPYFGDRVNWVKHYFCASCASSYIDFKERYALIKDWWISALMSEKKLFEEEIKEQKKKEVEKKSNKKLKELGPMIYLAEKIVKTKWGGAGGNTQAMKNIATSIKNDRISNEILEEILWIYMFHEDNETRATAKKIFMEKAPKNAQETVKKNWKASYRNSKELENHLANLGENLNHTKINFTSLLIKVLEDYDEPPHYLYRKDLVSYNNDRYPAIDALGIIGDPQAIEPLGQFMTLSLGTRWKDWKVEAIPVITSSLVKFGEPAIAPLVEALKCASYSKVGLEYNPWYVAGKELYDNYYPSTRIIANALKELKWEPETDEFLALQLVAMGKWSECAKLGEPALTPLIKNYEHEPEARDSIAKTLGKIGGSRAVRALTNREFFGHCEWWEYGDVTPEIFEALEKIDDVSVISVVLKVLEGVNQKTPSHRGPPACTCFHCKRFSIEELGMTEYYTNGLLKEIPSKPTFRKKYKIYGVLSQEASVAIPKILTKFEKNIVENYKSHESYIETLLTGRTIDKKWIAIVLQKIADKNLKADEKDNVLKFLQNDDEAMVMMGASMLKGILEE